jgi:mannose-6-phosphate isomerase-like protein (cupin superfamily)
LTAYSTPTRVAIDAADALSMPVARLSKLVLNTAGLEVRWYRPPSVDPQTPHDRDEVYVVVSGQGDFVRQGERVKFASGDLLFAAAGEVHRFENHTPDTAVWVIFGPGA